jgi:hypothetical protein
MTSSVRVHNFAAFACENIIIRKIFEYHEKKKQDREREGEGTHRIRRVRCDRRSRILAIVEIHPGFI